MDVKWSKSDMVIFVDENMAMLVTAPSRVFAAGIQPKAVYAFDSVTGALVWKQDRVLPDTIVTHDSVFYTTDLSTIHAYNITNGENIGNVDLPYSGTLMSIGFHKGKIFAYSSNGTFFVLDNNGQVQKSMGPNIYPVPYIVDDDITYASKNGLVALDTITGEVLWKANTDGTSYTGPLFLDDAIYVRTGSSVIPGNVYAINRNNGEILWKNNAKAISNPCPLGSNLYFLTWDGYLMVVDRISGQEVAKLEFSSYPFLLPTAGVNSGGYYVAADPENNVVFISLGDSYQLFALEIKSK
jgi:outer membrane protein assembly factor BamB